MFSMRYDCLDEKCVGYVTTHRSVAKSLEAQDSIRQSSDGPWSGDSVLITLSCQPQTSNEGIVAGNS